MDEEENKMSTATLGLEWSTENRLVKHCDSYSVSNAIYQGNGNEKRGRKVRRGHASNVKKPGGGRARRRNAGQGGVCNALGSERKERVKPYV